MTNVLHKTTRRLRTSERRTHSAEGASNPFTVRFADTLLRVNRDDVPVLDFLLRLAPTQLYEKDTGWLSKKLAKSRPTRAAIVAGDFELLQEQALVMQVPS